MKLEERGSVYEEPRDWSLTSKPTKNFFLEKKLAALAQVQEKAMWFVTSGMRQEPRRYIQWKHANKEL